MSARTGVQLIEDERLRQIEGEGFSDERDDRYIAGELVGAAICYALVTKPGNADRTGLDCYSSRLCGQWPIDWDRANWKPTPDRIRNLVKAGALLAAEIDRLQRSQPKHACERCSEPVPASQIFLHAETSADGCKHEFLCLDCKDAQGLASTAEANHG
jgi:hypothetical protein